MSLTWQSADKKGARISKDFRYSIHPTPMGWQAWSRIPFMTRIGDYYTGEADAVLACEGAQHEQKTQTRTVR